MNPIEQLLQHKKVVIVDGALATELERRGCDLKDELWSAKVLLEQPEIIRAVHLDYFNAGADIAITASYQASVQGFAKRGLNKDEAVALMKKSVSIAQSARNEFLANHKESFQPLIAASIGPYGAYLADGSEYRGDYKLTKQELIDFHRPRVEALTGSGADLLACETIPCLIEAQALIELLKEFPNAYAWFTFSAKDDKHISNGERIADCAEWLDQFPQVAAIGINCTALPYIPSLIREIKNKTDKPIIVYPNSGETYDPVTKSWYGETSCDAYGEQSKNWFENGATLIGGCCRTTPDHIKEIKHWADQLNEKASE